MRSIFITLALILITFIIGCSGGGESSPIIPEANETPRVTESKHMTWGLWQFTADPEAQTLDIARLRGGEMHLNALPFLEPPALVNLTLETLEFNGNIIDADIGLRHPFLGLDEFTGFDVCGTLISNGSISGFANSALRMAGQGDTRLLNPDGLSRWWNAAEFPHDGSMFSYKDGLLGVPDASANFNCTLNGYKLFSDDFASPDAPVGDLGPDTRCVFSAGQQNVRHYTIEIGNDGFVFNYAIDANWQFPNGSPPWNIPDDFGAGANRVEAWHASVTETENTLWNDGNNSGGSLSLLIDIWDHFDADLNQVYIESPGSMSAAGPFLPVNGGPGYSTYAVDILNMTPTAGTASIIIIAESENIGYQSFIPGDPVCGYFLHTANVGTDPNIPPTANLIATTSTDINAGETVSFDATGSTGPPVLTFTWDFNEDGVYDGPEDTYTGNSDTPTHTFNDSGTFNVTVKVSNPYGEDISDPVPVHVGYDPDDTFVDADYTGGASDGSMSDPYITIQDGMNAVLSGKICHVDYYDGGGNVYDTDGLSLKSNVTLIGDNWNGGGPGKPKAKNDNGTYTFGTSSSLSNFTLEGFELGLGELAGSTVNYGIYFGGSGNNNITVRYNNVTGTVDDTGKTGGPGIPINARYCDNSLFEYNDIGPITWESTTPGVYARVLWGMYFQYCDNTEVKNNFIHDMTIDYDGGGGFEQIRVFMLHAYACETIDIHNNLICHVEGINDYDYRIEGMMIEGYSAGSQFHYYNNTIDNLDHSQSDGGFSLRGIFIYSTSATGTYINNTLITNFYPGGSASIQAFFSSPSYIYDVTYSMGYNLGSVTDYFYNLIEGDGITNYPGINPQYVNNTTSPYDYTFQSGSGCENGDPNFIDWDDTGAPSGDPNEPNIENRSRMGCFGGPDGDWDPYDL